MADTRTDEEKAQDVLKFWKILAEIRLPYESMVDNIITYVNHSRRKITDKDMLPGQKTGVEVYDGTPLSAKNILVDGMVGYLCSRNSRWFAYTLPGKFNFPQWSGMRSWTGKRMDEYPEVKVWLQKCEESAYSAFERSNFYDVVPEFIGDSATTGTAYLDIEEDLKKKMIVFNVPHYRECFLAEDSFGFVDTNYRRRKYTLRQLVDKFDKKVLKIFNKTEENYRENPYEEHEVVRAIFPRKDFDGGRIDSKNKPIASIWVNGEGSGEEGQKFIDESGYDWLPVVTWRWRKNSDEWYGRSPAWDAFVTVMTGNEQNHTNLVAAHKMAEPPMIGPADLRGKVNTGPKGWTFVDTGMMNKDMLPQPLQTGIQLPYAVEYMDRIDALIKEFFHVPFFIALIQAMLQKVEMTATQVVGIQGEQAAVLGTRVERFQSEALNPIHDRVFNIEYRAGRMPEPPPILLDYAGGRIEIDYLGPLAQAQKRLNISRGLQAGAQWMTELTQANPEHPAWDKVKFDKVVEKGLDAFGFPADCIASDEEANEIRAIRNKQRAQQQMVEDLPKIAKAAAAAGKATEKGSPLADLTGGGVPAEGEQPANA